ncbi:MAG: glycosyl hydrolase family 28-related protein [Lentisphaerota bacterium]
MSITCLNVMDFGAKGDGRNDDTIAIQRTLDTASGAVLIRPDSQDIDYPDGIPARCGYHYHETGPEVFFPAGHYIISSPLLPHKVLALRGEGYPWIEQINDDQDIVYSEEAIRQSFECLAFHGGRMHLNLGNNNEDNGQVRIEDCKFYGSKATAIQMRKGSASTMLLVLRCQIVGCEQAVVTFTDFTHIREGWITGGCRGKGGALIVNHSEMTISNICTVPMVSGGDQRWIDNYGVLVCRNVRFGGEEGGFTPVVNFARHRPKLWGYSVILDSCSPVCGLGNAKRVCAVYCEEIPNLIEIRNCAFLGIPPVLVSDKIDTDTYFKANHDMLKFHFDGNIGEFSNKIPEIFKNPKINPPEEPQSLSDHEERQALEKARKDWIIRRNSILNAPLEFEGHKQQTIEGNFIDIAPAYKLWDLHDHMDGLPQSNYPYYTVDQTEDGILLMFRAIGDWPHILLHDLAIDLDKFPFLTWKIIRTGTPATLTMYAIDKQSGRSLLLASYAYSTPLVSEYWAYDLRKLLGEGGKRVFDIKIYYQGKEWVDGTRIKSRNAAVGDYVIIPFIRAEKADL